MKFCVENRLPHFHHQCNGPVLHFSEILLTGMNASEINFKLGPEGVSIEKLVLGSSGVMLLHLDLPNDTDHTSNQKF